MVKYEFQSILYRNSSDLVKAVAHQFITAGDLNNADDIRGFLAEQTDEELADECIAGWRLDATVNECEMRYDDEAKPITWLEYNEISRECLIEAISGLREEYNNEFVKNRY